MHDLIAQGIQVDTPEWEKAHSLFAAIETMLLNVIEVMDDSVDNILAR